MNSLIPPPPPPSTHGSSLASEDAVEIQKDERSIHRMLRLIKSQGNYVDCIMSLRTRTLMKNKASLRNETYSTMTEGRKLRKHRNIEKVKNDSTLDILEEIRNGDGDIVEPDLVLTVTDGNRIFYETSISVEELREFQRKHSGLPEANNFQTYLRFFKDFMASASIDVRIYDKYNEGHDDIAKLETNEQAIFGAKIQFTFTLEKIGEIEIKKNHQDLLFDMSFQWERDQIKNAELENTIRDQGEEIESLKKRIEVIKERGHYQSPSKGNRKATNNNNASRRAQERKRTGKKRKRAATPSINETLNPRKRKIRKR